MMLAQWFAPDNFSELSAVIAGKRKVIGFDKNLAARPLGIFGFKIQTALTVVMQGARIMKPRALVFKRNRGFIVYSSVSFL